MFLFVIFFPLVAFLFISLFGRFFGVFGSFILGLISLFLSLFASIFCFFEVGFCGSLVFFNLFGWVDGFVFFFWSLLFDSLSVTMLFVVLFVSSFVFLYSYDYLKGDPCCIRFFAFLLLFSFFMCFLVVSGNFVQLFFCWEGVGLCSYLLISFWYTRLAAVQSAFKAVMVNKFGDVFLFFGFVLCYYFFGSFDLLIFFFFFNFIYYDFFFVIVFFFFFGVLAKSAQIGLHVWLPDAMEGPTPVSALLHAATMVAVGVFFFLRISCIFFLVRGFLVIVLFLSVLTCFFCSLMALFQSDIKRIIAYSTCSQLGIMLAAVSLFYFSVAFFHLFTHAFFKALLFLGSGFIIHFFLDEQDIRRMGGILNFFILGYLFFFFGSLALVGFPFLSGFYSKDIIVELSFLYFFLDSFFVGFFVGLSSMFSLLYSFRLIWLAFFGFPNFWFLVLGKFFHSNWFMLISCVILFFSSCFFGFVFYDLFLGLGSIFWFSSFVGFEFYYYFFDLSFVSLFLQNSVFFFLVFGFIFGFLFNVFVFPHFFFIGEFFWSFYSFFCGRFYFDYVYNFFVDFVFKCFVFFVFDVDKGFLEFFGPYGVNYALSKISEFFICLQSGHLFHYFFLFILGIIFLLVLFFFTFFYVTFVFGFFCLIFPFLVYWFFCLLC